MSGSKLLISSVALRLLESSGTTWWLVAVPEGTERAVADELCQEISALDGAVQSWPGEPLEHDHADVTLLVMTNEHIQALHLDALRSQLAKLGVVAFIVAETNVRALLESAPHVASFIGAKLIETAVEDDEAPPEFAKRRLTSLRKAYAMSDEQAREAVRGGGLASQEIDFLEWMVLLGEPVEDDK